MTIYVVPTANSNLGCLLESVKTLDPEIVFLKEHNYSKVPNTRWKLFLYDDEYLSEELSEALPKYFENGQYWDFLSMYKKIEDINERRIYSMSPRLFKSQIQIRTDCIMPIDDNLQYETILDGFILGQP